MGMANNLFVVYINDQVTKLHPFKMNVYFDLVISYKKKNVVSNS